MIIKKLSSLFKKTEADTVLKSSIMLGVDPRSSSADKLTPYAPLPHISRKSLARVQNRLPIPNICCNCESGEVSLVSNSEIYGKEFGDWPYAYLCKSCDSYVGIHKHTDLPLGTLANKETREARKSEKPYFIKLEKGKALGDRNETYAWLAGKMKIPKEECHWSMFDTEQCFEAGAICRLELKQQKTGLS